MRGLKDVVHAAPRQPRGSLEDQHAPRDGVPFCGEFKLQFVVDLCYSSPHSLILTWMRLQGVSRKGYTSKPPVPEECEVNRLHGVALKKQKDAAEKAVARKRKRKE